MGSVLQTFLKGEKEIIFVGSTHEYNFSKVIHLKKILLDFNPEMVLVEDNFDESKFTSEEESIKKGGEMGFVSFLAKKLNLKVISNDPKFEECFSFLKEKYGLDFASLYFFLRDRCSLMKEQKFDKGMSDQDIIKYIQKKTNLRDYDYSFENIKKRFKEVFEKEFADDDYSDFFNPTRYLNKFNQATRELNIFRDDFMLEKIEELIKKYNKIFIIKGNYHLITMKNKIQELLENE